MTYACRHIFQLKRENLSIKDLVQDPDWVIIHYFHLLLQKKFEKIVEILCSVETD